MIRKICFFILHCITIPLSSYAQNPSNELDEKNGFKKIQFGKSIYDLPFLEQYEIAVEKTSELPTDSVYSFKIPDEDHTFDVGAVNIIGIAVYAYTDSIYKIIVGIDGRDKEKMLETLKQTFGTGYRQDKVAKIFKWLGKNVSLTYRLDASPAYMVYEYLPIIIDKNSIER